MQFVAGSSQKKVFFLRSTGEQEDSGRGVGWVGPRVEWSGEWWGEWVRQVFKFFLFRPLPPIPPISATVSALGGFAEAQGGARESGREGAFRFRGGRNNNPLPYFLPPPFLALFSGTLFAFLPSALFGRGGLLRSP